MPPTSCRFLLLAMVVLTSGCAWQAQNRLDRFDRAYNSADFEKAAELAGGYGDTDKDSGASDDLLWTLQHASALQASGDHAGATLLFDTTERFFRLYDERGALLQWGGQLLSVLTNDAALDYQGTVYDAIMVNSYKALNFLAQGQPELARVELNRARDRQRRAADYFAEELAQARDILARRSNAAAGVTTSATTTGATTISATTNSAVQQALAEAERSLAGDDYESFSEWSLYPAFINPLATYLQGLYLMTHPEAPGDFGRAADALRETREMVPESAVADEDWHWAEDLASGRSSLDELPPTVWVLYENGLGPVRDEQRIQLPIVLFNRNGPVFWSGIAYPVLRTRSAAQPSLSVQLRGGDPARTATLVNMDTIVGTEFRQRLPTVITRAVLAAVTKAAAQYQLQKDTHPLVALLGLLYQVVSTQADTRQWTSLPKTIELAKLERPARSGSRRVEVKADAMDGKDVDAIQSGATQADQLILSGPTGRMVALPDSQFTLVWVRQPTAAAAPAITVMPLTP